MARKMKPFTAAERETAANIFNAWHNAYLQELLESDKLPFPHNTAVLDSAEPDADLDIAAWRYQKPRVALLISEALQVASSDEVGEEEAGSDLCACYLDAEYLIRNGWSPE